MIKQRQKRKKKLRIGATIMRNDTKAKLIVILLIVGDILVFFIGSAFSQYLMAGSSGINTDNWHNIIIPLFFIMFFFFMYDLYTAQTDEVFNSAIAVFLSIIMATVSSVIIIYLFRLETVSVIIWLLRFAILELFMVSWRTFAASMIKRFGETRSCLIIENMHNTSRLARKLKYSSNYGREATYYMIDENNNEEIDVIINDKIKDYDQIFISPAISKQVTQRIMNKATLLHKQISVLADLDSVTTMHGRIYQLDDTPVIEKKILHMTRMQSFIKRSFDIVFSLVLCMLTLPIIACCAIAIHFDSEGPVIYKQERYTKNKKVFNVYKFRTMFIDAEKNGAQLATEDDPRITKVGKFLRATRLDELPQLYNILFGQMSVVGPRPERPVFADYFSENVNNYDTRYFVKAGLTGYAQVYGKYNTRVSDKILMDMIYIINYSFLLDIKIILLTAKTMFIKSATEGLDEERDSILSSAENEEKRRMETVKKLGIKGEKNENIHNNSGV